MSGVGLHDGSTMPVAGICYSAQFALELDPWVALHFIDGGLLELFFDDWKLAFFVQAIFETLESGLLTLFGSYMVFGPAANSDFETANGTILGDLVVNLCGILTVTILRRALGGALPPLWPLFRRDNPWPWWRAAVQLLAIILATGFLYAGVIWAMGYMGNADPAPWSPQWAVIATWALYMLWVLWFAVLPAASARYRQTVWDAARRPYTPWPFVPLAVIWTGVMVAPALSLPYTVPTVYAYSVAFLCVALGVYTWQGRTRRWYGRWPRPDRGGKQALP